MSLGYGPSIATRGLAFAYDAESIRSWKGRPMTNQAQQPVVQTATNTGIQITASSQEEYIPEVGKRLVTTATIYNHYTQYTPNSTSCCPNPFRYHGGGNMPVSPSTEYTYAILYRVDSGYTHPNFMYRYEFNGTGTKVFEGGLHSNSSRVSLGNGWYYAWGTFVTRSTTATMTNYLFYYRYSNVPDNISIGNVMIAPGNYSQLHPKYWAEPGTSRLPTQCLLDWTGNTTITMNGTSSNSSVYPTDGKFEFTPSANAPTAANVPALQLEDNVTLSAWVYPHSTSGSGNILCKNYNNGYRYRIQNGFLWMYSNSNSVTSSSAICPNNQWHHCVAVFSTIGLRLYHNGQLVASNSTPYNPSNAVAGELIIGGYTTTAELFDGKIDVARVYNAALTDREIKNDYLASRGRFGHI